MGFMYNGIHSKNMKLKARLTSWQASPPLRNSYEIVPGKVGIADFGCDSSERYIKVSCNIYPQRTFENLVKVLDDISAWLNPMEGLKQLVLEDVPDRFFLARLNTEIDCERILSSAGSFELTFICPNPNGYAITDEQFTFSTTGSHELVRNIGNINSYPIYQIKGNIDSSSSSFVTITTNGEELKLIGRLASNEILVIDSLLLTAKVTDLNGNTLRNGLPILDELNFPILNKGSNEIIISTNNATFSELNILANSCWR